MWPFGIPPLEGGSASSQSEPLDTGVGRAASVLLEAGIAKVFPLLEEHGFSREGTTVGVSSGGQFASVTFRRAALEIGLIIREGQLGCPNYSVGSGYAGHDELLWALERSNEARLVPGPFLSFRASDGEDPFVALTADLRDAILPVLARCEADLSDAISRAHRKGQERIFGSTTY